MKKIRKWEKSRLLRVGYQPFASYQYFKTPHIYLNVLPLFRPF